MQDAMAKIRSNIKKDGKEISDEIKINDPKYSIIIDYNPYRAE